jgi:hypothetical protein
VVTVTFLALVFWAWLIGPLGAILAIPLTLLAKAVLVDVDPHAGWADALLRASATKPEPPAAEVTAEAERPQGDTSSPPALCHRRRWRSLANRAASRRPKSHEF